MSCIAGFWLIQFALCFFFCWETTACKLAATAAAFNKLRLHHIIHLYALRPSSSGVTFIIITPVAAMMSLVLSLWEMMRSESRVDSKYHLCITISNLFLMNWLTLSNRRREYRQHQREREKKKKYTVICHDNKLYFWQMEAKIQHRGDAEKYGISGPSPFKASVGFSPTVAFVHLPVSYCILREQRLGWKTLW